jgi:hypothetical protein
MTRRDQSDASAFYGHDSVSSARVVFGSSATFRLEYIEHLELQKLQCDLAVR